MVLIALTIILFELRYIKHGIPMNLILHEFLEEKVIEGKLEDLAGHLLYDI